MASASAAAASMAANGGSPPFSRVIKVAPSLGQHHSSSLGSTGSGGSSNSPKTKSELAMERIAAQVQITDLEKYSGNFTSKAVQVIVQSRMGEKIKYANRPACNTDWFNLAIDDNADVHKKTKEAMGTNSPPEPIVVEIILKTSDSKQLTLELWNVFYTDSVKDPNYRMLSTLYNRMSLLLKSLISITRVLPAYKLSRMKGDYFIFYNIHSGIPQYNNLGRECKITTLGSVTSPYGTIRVEFGYRTKMEISFEQCPVVCKEDHFNILDSTHQPIFEQATQVPRSPNSAKIPAFSEPFPILTTEFDEDDIPFSNLLKKSTNCSNQIEPDETDDGKMEPPAELQHEIDSSSGEDPPAFEFIEIKPPPFAPELPDSDPAAFFATLQNAPPLTSLPDLEIREIDQQMQIFEENLDFFDDFVSKLCVND